MSGYQGLTPTQLLLGESSVGPKEIITLVWAMNSSRQNFLFALEITQKKLEAGLGTDCAGQGTDGEVV